MEQLTIAGTVQPADAVLRRTQSGDAVLSFKVVIDQGKDKDGNKRDGKWFDCSLWGKRAESLERYITKGTALVLTGRPTAREHNGKAYLGINVQELTFMGSFQRQDTGGAQSSGNAGGGRPFDDLDGDDVPF